MDNPARVAENVLLLFEKIEAVANATAFSLMTVMNIISSLRIPSKLSWKLFHPMQGNRQPNDFL